MKNQKKTSKKKARTITEEILESISDGVFTIDSDWRITSFNRAAEEITGISREEAIGKICADVFRSNMCEANCALRQTLETGKPIVSRAGYIIDAYGMRIPISLSTAVMRDSQGNIAGGAETFRDLSEVESLRKELSGKYRMGDFVSHSSAMKKVFELAPAVASSVSTVLLLGETGTGKELLARAIHNASARSKNPFIALNCGALPDTLLESELFGYKKGAFTGAEKDKLGRFALANNGTLFLDEIGEVSPALQVRLLRVLQEHTYEPLGSTATEKTSARIICATGRNLKQMVADGTFRQDLFYRINIISIELPPLRERIEDIPLLVNHFISRFNNLQNRQISGISEEVLGLLMAHNWPGNIRELENIIERAFVLCSTDIIGIEHLPANIVGTRLKEDSPEDFNSSVRSAQIQTISNALKKSNNNKTAAAKLLGIHKTTLYRRMKSLSMDIDRDY